MKNSKLSLVLSRVKINYGSFNLDVSFQVEPGTLVSLLGPSGSGKTTIISLINRLYDINGGAIQIDGNDIRDFELKTLRCQIATIPQDPFIFTGTVAENISMHDPRISRDMIMEAAERAHAHSFIKNLAAKYDEPLLEEGKKLSAGQRQLLSFARAFVRRPSIIILDEATSSIDSETERLLDAAGGG